MDEFKLRVADHTSLIDPHSSPLQVRPPTIVAMSSDHPEALFETLNNIHILASSISHQLETVHHIAPLPNPEDIWETKSTFPSLILNTPGDLLAPIKNLQVPDNIRQELLVCFQRSLDQLQQQYQSTYQRACLVNHVSKFKTDFDALQKAYQSLYYKHVVPMIGNRVSSVLEQVAKCQWPASRDIKRPFNAEYSQFLEKYFEFNGYPSMAHRKMLAEKSEMAPRQIEVWFQNHRNRAKKEGRIIPRLDSDFPLKKALDTLKPNVPICRNRLPTPPVEEVQKIEFHPKHKSAQHVNFMTKKAPTFLDDTYGGRPTHAFPAQKDSGYPEPFPTYSGVFKFSSPIWRRQPTTVPIVSMAVDMDEFSQAFHLKLNFSENSRRRGTTPSKREPPPSQPWFHATRTTPSPAPHPALVRKRDVCQPASRSLDTLMAKPIIFGPNFLRVDTSTAFLAPPGEAPARKTRPLPRRTPPRSPSSSFCSRTSSFSSDTSSESNASSSSSSSSYSSSPELSTPPPLPDKELPVVHDDAQHQDYLFDFSQTDLDTDYSSASQTFDFSFDDPSLNKVSDLSFFGLNFSDFNNLGEILS